MLRLESFSFLIKIAQKKIISTIFHHGVFFQIFSPGSSCPYLNMSLAPLPPPWPGELGWDIEFLFPGDPGLPGWSPVPQSPPSKMSCGELRNKISFRKGL